MRRKPMNTAQKSRYLKELIHNLQYDSFPAESGTGERMWPVIPGVHLWTGCT